MDNSTSELAVEAPIYWKYIVLPIVTLIISCCFSLYLFNKKKNDDYLSYLDKHLDDIIKLSMSYPYVEHADFCNSWSAEMVKTEKNDEILEKYLHYNIFSNLVFNYLARVANHCKYDIDKIQEIINFRDWARLHKKIWYDPLNDQNENINSYTKEFVSLMRSEIGESK
ncbi:hypothetical protein [Providencia rettgeri]|uniref:hypothetical protein n=1 Tax=Providencia rettgeri TaxID=587 RepID=UPI0024802C63|nr:hypothetical protein [Providencia rettgeri]